MATRNRGLQRSGSDDYAQRTMATEPAQRRATTPPKGRPTRSRNALPRRRVFGSTAQWIAAVAILLLALVIVIIVLDDKASSPLGVITAWSTTVGLPAP